MDNSITTGSGQIHLLPANGGETRPERKSRGKRANDLDGKTWIKYSISIWDDIRKTSEESSIGHPASFPLQLVERLIRCFTRKDQKYILDPFVGIGSTAIAAEGLGRIGIGLDISEEFIHKAASRPRALFADEEGIVDTGERRLFVDDAASLLDHVYPESVDLVITSPPYWDILLRKRTADYKQTRNYGASETDLGRIPIYEDFLRVLADVFKKVYAALRPGSYCCVVVMDIRKKNRFFPFHSDLAIRLQQIGFVFDDLIIWDRSHEYNNLRPLGHPAVFRVNKVHEFILIMQKPPV